MKSDLQLDDFTDAGPRLRDLTYVVITPAKNEAALIRRALDSVIAQTVRPSQWVIVDDGSTDRTAGIVEEYALRYPFISLLRLANGGEREFSNKVTAFNAGLQSLKERGYSFIGNLDADISLKPDYYEAVLQAFSRDPQLGIAGGRVHTTINGEFICSDTTQDSVGGAVQLFRRKCFEEIGGYRGLPFGGIDAAAEILARWKGWAVRKVSQDVYEHRQTGSAQHNIWRGRFRDGLKFHSLGYGGIFFACRCLFRLTDSPIFIGSVLSLIGFAWAAGRKYPICMPREAVAYLQSEQNSKLRRSFLRSKKLRRPTMSDSKGEDNLLRSAPRDW